MTTSKNEITNATEDARLGELYGRSARTIRNWRHAGYPVNDPDQMRHVIETFRGGGYEKSTPEMKALQVRKTMLQCNGLERANEQTRAAHVSTAEVRGDFARIKAAVSAELDKIESEVPALLVGKNEAGMQKVLRAATYRMRQNLANMKDEAPSQPA